MSAIFGIFHLDGRPVNPADLAKMDESLAHRGPDGSGIRHDGSVGFGHRMLCTTPESLNEHLPLVNESAHLMLTADARIDNREELIEALGMKYRAPEDITDSELIMGAYEKWCERCPNKLLGDFAFAIWNGRTRTLFCARDHTSIKPFYYYRSHRLFAFASEIKGLLSLVEVPRRLNEEMVPVYLSGWFDKADTLYSDIHRLKEASSITVDSRAMRVDTYWSLDARKELRPGSDEDYLEGFRSILSEAIRCRLRSAYPVGSCLSGGLDSSSIVGVARRFLNNGAHQQPLATYSAVFPSLVEQYPKIDERPYMDAVIAQGDVEPHFVHTDIGPMTDIERVTRVYDSPNIHFNIYIHWALFKAANRHGTRVLLSGNDGDTVVSYGYEYLSELAYTGRWKTLLKESRALSRTMKISLYEILRHFVFGPLLPEPVLELWRKLRRKPEQWHFTDIIHPGFSKNEGLIEQILPSFEALRRTAREDHRLSLTSPLILMGPELIDRAAGAFSVEMRYPFFDRRLRELCLALPVDQKLRNGCTRSIIRRAMAGILPPEVDNRISKGDLSPNFLLRLLQDNRRILEESIMKNPSVLEGLVDIPSLQSAYRRYASQPMQRRQEAYAVFLASCLAIWLRSSGIRR